jgi:Mn-dependent DtxR family transcriptional regulator
MLFYYIAKEIKMRDFRLTEKGKKEAKIARLQRSQIMDFLYPSNHATMEELLSMFGSSSRTEIISLQRKGLIEEDKGATF